MSQLKILQITSLVISQSLADLAKPIVQALLVVMLMLVVPGAAWSLSSPNIPLDSPLYDYLDKLAGFGLLKTDIKGIKPFSRSEAARLTLEAERNLDNETAGGDTRLAREIIAEIRRLIPREMSLYNSPEKVPGFDFNPLSNFRLRYVYLSGSPRSYNRPVHDPGNDGVFGIGSGLRPPNPPSTVVYQHGMEGTPLFENNEGNIYRDGNNAEFRFSTEAYVGGVMSALLEPQVSHDETGRSTILKLNKGYLKLGGGGLELEVGRDANWLGLGYRGAITLTNNAKNFDMVKISSPEPVSLRYIGLIKYDLIFSRFDETRTNGQVRRPWFLAAKLSVKPTELIEAGINLGRQVGGPGVNNSFGSIMRGFVGGTSSDNSNSISGLELRLRLPFLRNAEMYGEFSGEDSASFWPIVESYIAGIYFPRLTASGRDDFRFEFFKGNRILYTNSTFPEGYVYNGIPIGHSQGGATIEFYTRYSHWFSPRNNLALEYFRTDRGHEGRVEVNGVEQALEKKHAGRISWTLPVYGDLDMNLMYGIEKIHNVDLVDGIDRTNQVFKAELRFKY